MRGNIRFFKLTKWNQEIRHNFFMDRKTGRIAIADGSGDYPDETDNGILYVDFSRKMEPEKRSYLKGRGWVYIYPLEHEHGAKLSTFADDYEAVWLKKHGMLGLIMDESYELVHKTTNP